MVTQLDPLDRSDLYDLQISKIKDGGGRHLFKIQKHHISATVWAIWTKFGMGTHTDPVNPVDCWNFDFLKIQDGGWPPAISQQPFDWSPWNLAPWRRFTLLTLLIVKNLKFWKSKLAAAAILKNWKIATSQQPFDPIATKLGMVEQFDPLDFAGH